LDSELRQQLTLWKYAGKDRDDSLLQGTFCARQKLHDFQPYKAVEKDLIVELMLPQDTENL